MKRPARPGWEGRVEQFVDARSEAARHAEGTEAKELAGAHRALAEGAWYVLELARQHPGRPTSDLRRLGATTFERWQASADPADRDRRRAADWALWVLQARHSSWLGRARRARAAGPLPERGA